MVIHRVAVNEEVLIGTENYPEDKLMFDYSSVFLGNEFYSDFRILGGIFKRYLSIEDGWFKLLFNDVFAITPFHGTVNCPV